MITLHAQNSLTIGEDSDKVYLKTPRQAIIYDANAKMEKGSETDEDISKILRCEFNLHDRALSTIYKRPELPKGEDGKPKKSSHIWHVVYQLSNHGMNGRLINGYLPCIERRELPDVLHLAQAASKRCRSSLYVKPGPKKTAECHFDVTPVHEALENSLHYI